VGDSILETAEGCFSDLTRNTHELLADFCKMSTPSNSICFYHPALGPLYSIIGQKIRGGELHEGAELQLEIAELDMENLVVDGSLLIQADDLMGHPYSEKSGKCTLKNVKVLNRGIDRAAPNVFWKNEIHRKESCKILIHGDGEFYAENVSLDGSLLIEVESGTKVSAVEENGKIAFKRELIHKPTWFWKYSVSDDFEIVLERKAQG
jgi:UTP---glucose-1-phosphate uridylyltransferase